jgi:hypothetical protein
MLEISGQAMKEGPREIGSLKSGAAVLLSSENVQFRDNDIRGDSY